MTYQSLKTDHDNLKRMLCLDGSSVTNLQCIAIVTRRRHDDHPIPNQGDKAHDDHLPLAQVQLTSSRLKSSLHTPLYDFHVAQGGKMVDFAGWESSQCSCQSANIWSVINQLLDPSLKTTPRYRLPVQYSDLGISASHLHTRHSSIIMIIIIIIFIIHDWGRVTFGNTKTDEFKQVFKQFFS